MFVSGRRMRRGGWVDERIWFGFTNPVGTGGVLDVCLCCGGECVGGLEQGLEE